MKKTILMLTIIVAILTATLGFSACNDDVEEKTLRVVAPDGTPALAMARLNSDNKTLAGYEMTYEIVASATISTEMTGEKADVLIMPTNAGATLIKKGAPYKLAAVSVEGSLYVVGAEGSGENGAVTFADLKDKKIVSIGQNNTPDKVFRYIVDHTDGVSYSDFTVDFVADAAAAKAALIRENEPYDYAIVGEPAATAFGSSAIYANENKKLSHRMDLQKAYKAATATDTFSGYDSFPQASLFIKTSLLSDTTFVNELFAALEASRNWVIANPASVTETLKANGSTAAFPAVSIPRCAVVVKKASDNKEYIKSYLELMSVPTDDTIFA
jgi:hypothetical protein